MSIANVEYRDSKVLPKDQVVSLYASMGWSSAERADDLMAALANSHAVISAWIGEELIGLGNALSDGYLVVYYPHLIVRLEYQKKGIGRAIVERMKRRYAGFHQQMLVADACAIEFYKRCGFEKAGSCAALWIYKGNDHD